MGLERLSERSRKMIQTSEIAKEVQIRASREKDPERQLKILRKAAEEGKTVREIRREQNVPDTKTPNTGTCINDCDDNSEIQTNEAQTFTDWSWKSEDGKFSITVHFYENQPVEMEHQLIETALEAGLMKCQSVIE